MVKKNQETLWFHAGEFSDSLALSHITGELPVYFETFKNSPQLKLELRTKSANVSELLKLAPLPNVITSFSLSPGQRIQKTDLKTPSLTHRLLAMSKLQKAGHPIAIHLDPVIHEDNFEASYLTLFKEISSYLDINDIEYLSIGVVRFTGDVYRQVLKNYPKSELHAAEFLSLIHI